MGMGDWGRESCALLRQDGAIARPAHTNFWRWGPYSFSDRDVISEPVGGYHEYQWCPAVVALESSQEKRVELQSLCAGS